MSRTTFRNFWMPLLLALLAAPARGAEPNSGSKAARPETVATFSIVASDPLRKQWGVAVQSRVLAVGALVPSAQAEVGAIATQAYANTTFGPRGLKLLAGGLSAADVVAKLLETDADREERQLAVIDAQGKVANFTGKQCLHWAGAVSGKHYSCQGNILTGENVVRDMATAFEQARGELAERLIAALEAAQKAGGDRRGEQSAALLVVKKGAGYGGFDDRMIDLRVDDNIHPIAELSRLLDLRLQRQRP